MVFFRSFMQKKSKVDPVVAEENAFHMKMLKRRFSYSRFVFKKDKRVLVEPKVSGVWPIADTFEDPYGSLSVGEPVDWFESKAEAEQAVKEYNDNIETQYAEDLLQADKDYVEVYKEYVVACLNRGYTPLEPEKYTRDEESKIWDGFERWYEDVQHENHERDLARLGPFHRD